MFRENSMHWTDGRIYRRTVQQLTRPIRKDGIWSRRFYSNF